MLPENTAQATAQQASMSCHQARPYSGKLSLAEAYIGLLRSAEPCETMAGHGTVSCAEAVSGRDKTSG